jgi:hypothetical protein
MSTEGNVMLGVYQDHGIRFEYPPSWEIEEQEDGTRTTVSVHAPTGLSFAMVTVDTDCPDPRDLAEEALEAMREEYPGLDALEAREEIDGHTAVGHDLEFFSFDLASGCSIRSYRTDRHTVLVFGQWTDAEDDMGEQVMEALRRSMEDLAGDED